MVMAALPKGGSMHRRALLQILPPRQSVSFEQPGSGLCPPEQPSAKLPKTKSHRMGAMYQSYAWGSSLVKRSASFSK